MNLETCTRKQLVSRITELEGKLQAAEKEASIADVLLGHIVDNFASVLPSPILDRIALYTTRHRARRQQDGE